MHQESRLEPADNFSEQQSIMTNDETESTSKQMFQNRGKLSKQDMQK